MEEEAQKGTWLGWFCVLLVMGLIGGAIGFIVHQKMSHKKYSGSDDAPRNSQSYGHALKIALQFLEIQKSGKLEDNKIAWRGDSALNDGSEAKIDLSKGMYDAGDHMKFGLPMAFTATMLSWAMLEYGDQMKTLNQYDSAQASLRWITDYLVNAHPKDDVLYIQVGDPALDHKCWDRPETMTEERPLLQINKTTPGTEVAAEAAAAMAAASLVFKKSDSKYSEELIKHAKALFKFADADRKIYSVSLPQVAKFYNSTGYGDELLWAASWLYHATEDSDYFKYVTGKEGDTYAEWGKLTWFSWDNKLAGTQVLLSRVNFFSDREKAHSVRKYRSTAENLMCGLLPDSPSATNRTKAGLIWVAEWSSLQHPVASAFLAALFGDYMITSKTNDLKCGDKSYKPSDLRKFAMSQADYVLGSNPMKMSYLVGYGDKYPQFVHHRGASIPADATTGCSDGWSKWMESKDPNPNVATGAMVGGPFLNDTYIDDRNNSKQAEPSTYNSAVVIGLLSSLVSESTQLSRSFT